nr:LINE-1 retrotransposable element ORF2 protein [Helicoverpa armigera]
MKIRTRIACWNVRTLSEDSRLAQAETEMLRYKLQILGLSEVRRNGFGELRTSRGLTFLYSGKEDEEDVRENGVGFLLSDAAKKSLLDWKPISERIITARFNSKARKITVVQCYAPTNPASEEDKDDFYSALNLTLKNIRKQDIVIVMGDLNAKVGTDNDGCQRHMGTHGMGVRNGNGERFLEFCQDNDLTIGGTLFIHGDHHKYTWNSPDGITKNQIDHLAISSKWRSSLLDVRNRRGADIDSDHHLVVAEVRLKVAVARAASSTSRVGKRFEVNKLRDPDITEAFRLELRNRFSVLEPDSTTSVNAEWNHIKMAYTETSSVVLGHKTYAREDWMSQRTWNLIEERRQLHLQLLTTSDVAVRQDLKLQYSLIRRKIYRSTRHDRRVWADSIADCAQRAANSSNLREMYKATKTLAGNRNQRKKKPLKDKGGQLIVTSEGQLQRWREHFEEIFRVPSDPVTTAVPAASLPTSNLDIDVSPPTGEEVMKAIRRLKNGKAPGVDLITAEMLKADITTAANALTPLLQNIWSAEKLPDDWNKGLLITVPKKGDLSECGNWRGITLLSTPSKVLCQIILDRLSGAVEPLLRKEQAGFRPNRSCTDQINTLRIILEQASEWQRDMYLTFVDFEKAFDTLRWNCIWDRLREIGVPEKITTIIKAIYGKYSCRVTHDGLVSEDIPVHAGVRQGCLLSPLLFLVVLDGIMHHTTKNKRRGIEWGLSNVLEDLDYADDLCLLSHTRTDMQAKLDDLQREAMETGLKINTRKTQEMRCGVTCSLPLLIGTEGVERVHKFTYLGSVVSETGGTEEDITSRIAKGRATFAQLRPVWQSRKLTRRVKLKIFRSNVKTVLLYGCETWKATKDISRKLQVFVNRCLRRILGIYWPEKISNIELWERCGETPIDQQIKRRKWNWIGHTLRRDPDHIPRQALDWNPQGKRKRGRPKQSWRRTIIAEAAAIGRTWSEIKREAQDRTRWRSTVDALCPI